MEFKLTATSDLGVPLSSQFSRMSLVSGDFQELFKKAYFIMDVVRGNWIPEMMVAAEAKSLIDWQVRRCM